MFESLNDSARLTAEMLTVDERLRERLKDAITFNVWWGDDAHKLSPQERADAINKILDDHEAGLLEPIVWKDAPKTNIRELVASLNKPE